MKTVLIVDDEKNLLESLKFGFSDYADDFSIVTAENGARATVILASMPVDLVVTDLKMPVLDGFELLAHMSRNYPNIPAIVMTAHGKLLNVEQRIHEYGISRYIQKPFELEDLTAAIISELQLASSGQVHGLGLADFLGLISTEERSCTVALDQGGETGVMYFQRGELLDAEVGALHGADAFHRMLNWAQPKIDIQWKCDRTARNIRMSIDDLLREGMRRWRQGGLTEQPAEMAEAVLPIDHDEAHDDEASPENAAVTPEINVTLAPPQTVAASKSERPPMHDIADSTIDEALQRLMNDPAAPVTASEPPAPPEVAPPVEAEERVSVPSVNAIIGMNPTRDILAQLANMAHIEAVCLVARDGFLLESIAKNGIDAEMIAAIASSGFGASDAMGRQLEKGRMLHCMIEFDRGPVLLAPIGDDALLVMVAGSEANLGMVRIKLKKHSSELALVNA